MARLNCVTILAPAKLNLALDVVGLLPGGYHDLDKMCIRDRDMQAQGVGAHQRPGVQLGAAPCKCLPCATQSKGEKQAKACLLYTSPMCTTH